MPCKEESTPEGVIPGDFCGSKKYDKSTITNYSIVVTVAQFHSHPNMQFSGQWKLQQRIANISGSRTAIQIIFIWLESRFFPLSNDSTYVRVRAHFKVSFFGNSLIIDSHLWLLYAPFFRNIFAIFFLFFFEFVLYFFWFFAGNFGVFCFFLTHLDRYGIFDNFGIFFGTFRIHGTFRILPKVSFFGHTTPPVPNPVLPCYGQGVVHVVSRLSLRNLNLFYPWVNGNFPQ